MDARGSPMPRTDFRLSHTAHRAPPAVSQETRTEESRTQAMRQGRTGSRCARRTLLPPQLHLLLLEVSPVLLVDEHQVEEVFDRELVVNVLERGCQVVEPAKEESDRDGLAPDGRAVHDLKLGDRLALVER